MWSFPLARHRTAARAPERRLLIGALVASLIVLAAAPLGAAPRSVGEPVTEARLLKQLYLIGLGRMARGDPDAAVAPFQVVTEVAPELVEAQHLLAAAMVLSDFGRRQRALPIIDKALAAEPGHPLYTVVRAIADPAASSLREDGALYFTPSGAARMKAALEGLAKAPRAYNARYLAPVLAAMEPTPEPAFPERLPRFAALLGRDGRVAVGGGRATVPFARLFAMSIDDERFAPHVRDVVAVLPRGVFNLASGNETLPFGPTANSNQGTMELLLDAAPRSVARR